MKNNQDNYDLYERILRSIFDCKKSIEKMEHNWNDYYENVASERQKEIMRKIRAEYYEALYLEYEEL